MKKSSIWRHGIWRAEVEVRVYELSHRLAAAIASRRLSKRREAAKGAVEISLEKARDQLRPPGTRWEGLVSWWTGDTIATAWEAVHEAEVRLVCLERNKAVKANLPWLLLWIRNAMEKSERRSNYEKDLEDQEKKNTPPDRTKIEQAYRDVIVVNSERYANLRSFRNNLILVTGILLGLVCGLVLWHWLNVDVMALCSSKSKGALGPCLDGTKSHRWDLALVAVVGAVGGMLAIAFGLANTEALPSRYDPRVWQVLLKPVAGAATALAGVLLIQSDLLISPAGTRSESVLLAYALLFGFSQQLFTQFVDKQAGSLIEVDGGDSKDATRT